MSSTEAHPYHGLDQPDTSNATWFNPKEKGIDDYWKIDEAWEVTSAFRFPNKRDWHTYQMELNEGIRNGKHTNDPYWTYRDNLDHCTEHGQQEEHERMSYSEGG